METRDELRKLTNNAQAITMDMIVLVDSLSLGLRTPEEVGKELDKLARVLKGSAYTIQDYAEELKRKELTPCK